MVNARSLRHVVLSLAALLVLGLTVGCGDSEQDRFPVSGTVKLDGTALPQGTIEFHPADGKGSMAGATIKDGKYEIPEEKGLLAGKYKIRISAAGKEMAIDPNAPPGEPKVAKDRIPPQYNVKTTLEETVAEGADNVFNFDLKSK